MTGCAFVFCAALLAGEPGDRPAALAEVDAATLRPYDGPGTPGVDCTTLTGKVVCGYQGWFTAEGDGAERGWTHWSRGGRRPTAESIRVDLWPDVSQLGPDERFATDLTHSDGRPAELFSSFRRPTVLRHFQWMQQYGIDGAMVQRFAVGLNEPRSLRHNNTVLAHCREGANRHGRTYSLMYDLSGLRAGQVERVADDWRRLRSAMHLTEDPAYLHHRGRPLVTVWGIGFNDNRPYTLAECRRLVEQLKADGCTVMLGVPTYWRTLRHDTLSDPALHEIIALADVVSPWTVGRYRSPEEAARHARTVLADDLAWCGQRGLDYLPVVFPGFSWHNMHRDQRPAPLNQIPRLKGELFRRQIVEDHRAGAKSLYVAMFDEVDEGTAIFRLSEDPPTSDGVQFVGLEGVPGDHYLTLAGRAARLLRGELPAGEEP